MRKQTHKILAFTMTILLAMSVFSVMGSAQESAQIKNIIYLIGDGMGPNHLEAYKYYTDIDVLHMETIKNDGYYGHQVTRSFGKIQTDSAAGGTALACGVHTWVNAVGVYPTDPFALLSYPMNLRELAEEQGMKSGIVVTKPSDDATPAAFSAHTYARGNSEVINQQQLESNIEVLMGASTGHIDEAAAKAKGFAYATTGAEMLAATGEKLIGQFDGGNLKKGLGEGTAPSLVAMAQKAVEMLENPNGFFLMIEGSTIDSFSHSNEMEGMLDAFKGFEAVVSYALAYARDRSDTMVIITADHETGGITWDAGKKDFYFTTGGHTNTSVPYFAYIPTGIDTTFAKDKEILNIDVAKNIANTMGWGDVFPARLYSDFGAPIKPVMKVADMVFGAFDTVSALIPDAITAPFLSLYLFVVDGVAELVGMF